MADLCSQALQHGIEVEYVQHLIRKRQLVPKEPPLTIPHWPWAIKIFTLGSLSIDVDGHRLQSSRKAPRKPLQLLKILIALGGKDIAETQITDMLWPDADGDLAHQTFATTLHRLRKLLQHEEALLLHNKHVSINPRYCWVDLWAWDALVSPTSSTHSTPGESNQVTQALEFYQGPFLPDEPDEPWAEWPRRRVQSQFLRLLETQASVLVNSNLLQQAQQLLEHASLVEPKVGAMLEKYVPSAIRTTRGQ